MFVKLATECLGHGHEGARQTVEDINLVVATGVFGASHRWLKFGKTLKAESAMAEFYEQDFAEVFPHVFLLGLECTERSQHLPSHDMQGNVQARSYLFPQLSFSNLCPSQVAHQQSAV